jgi:LmbE family N-acetylglucosaminyl deacetylase
MGLLRREEAIAADGSLGVSPENLIFLGYPDFKTLNIWYSNWGSSRPAARSMLTKVRAVPYSNAFHPGAPYKGESILEDLKTIIRDFKPTKIFVSHPADFNADHKALYLFTRVALWDLEKEVPATIHPYLIHYKKWPLPRGYHPHLLLTPPKGYEKQIPWKLNVLTQAEIELNRTAIKKHRSQYSSTPGYLLTFIRSPELFGDFPVIAVRRGIEGDLITPEGEDEPQVLPSELTGKEKDLFVGIEERSAHFINNNLVISIRLSKRMGKSAGLSLYVFGYRKDKPFVDMPKIRIRFGTMGYRVLDQNKKVLKTRVTVTREQQNMIVTIPLGLLGNPDKILTSANTYLGAIPLDTVPWRTLEIQRDLPTEGAKIK